VQFKIHDAISVKQFITGFIVFRPEYIMQFTAMTRPTHLEIDYLLNTCSWKIIAKRCAD